MPAIVSPAALSRNSWGYPPLFLGEGDQILTYEQEPLDMPGLFSASAVILGRCNAIADEQGVAVAENLLQHSRRELPLDSRNNTALQPCERRREIRPCGELASAA